MLRNVRKERSRTFYISAKECSEGTFYISAREYSKRTFYISDKECWKGMFYISAKECWKGMFYISTKECSEFSNVLYKCYGMLGRNVLERSIYIIYNCYGMFERNVLFHMRSVISQLCILIRTTWNIDPRGSD